MINRTKLEHILEYARQQKCIGQLCKIPPGDMVEIVEMAMRKAGNSPVTPAGWISCSDAVPAEYCDVILRDDLGNVFPGSWDKVFCPTRGGNKMAFVDQDGVEVEDSTHWMPLPEPPQEEKSGNADCSDTSGKTDNPQASGKQVNELTMLVKQLVSQLKKAKPDCKLPDKAMDYLKRNGLISVEDILR
ncbi:TPA: DUF551 domain-containing protein [Escherichia coli]|nr:DUF551 domain-containing protein [Escherichia coli]HAZ3607671.1 DUF551 domain-containing protein [Escherichia coli]HAZ3679668.1 DUF551 domain-containing protein [Escherichia coli]HBA8273962.1 DUF551 domain-containing protein [Escherichia coli]